MILLALAGLAATPTNLTAVLTAARPGDTMRLVAGSYGPVEIKRRTWNPPITIDASAAAVAGVSVATSTGVAWVGGTISGTAAFGTDANGYGFTANWQSSNISVTGVQFTNFRLGVGFNLVDGGKIAGNWFTRMSSDGIDVSLSRNVVVDHNTRTDFNPGPGAHPDCIRLWSRPTAPPTADIQITNNSMIGSMQGITLSNHIRDGVDDGGFDRVTIRNNTVLNIFAGSVGVGDCRGCTIRDYEVNSLPNYINKAQLYVVGGSVVQCGNKVPMIRQGTPPCTAAAGS